MPVSDPQNPEGVAILRGSSSKRDSGVAAAGLRYLVGTRHEMQDRGSMRQLVDRHARAHLSRKVAQVLMVGEVDHLAHLCHFGEEAEGLLRTEIVKGLHDVIGEEGHRWMRRGELMIPLPRQRMDFLLLLPGRQRIVILPDMRSTGLERTSCWRRC